MFRELVLKILSAVPAGRVTTYAALARAVGRPGAARAVGNALHQNPQPIVVPCHRVVRSDGLVGGYRFGSSRKKALLVGEGIRIESSGQVENFSQILFTFESKN